MNPKQALEAAITIVGGQSALARAIGLPVQQSHVYYWLHTAGQLPAEHCAAVERATKRKIRKSDLRPDVFPPRKAA